ncbi:MAG: 2-methylfumaryl-CoA isomerase [SAR86 cluster bacterium]|uniref:2-methylfumaryl-CoA isomerase n=1 Tax=SAR86 cluster bacterium TaxID=2030880 RepID=A0A2A5BA72_9GAMM|nr:MAG: 2-methylfumaryl-CoA isomerase [SAR86 cluster bacterium]
MQKPLSGLRLVEGSAFIAAPSGGMTLAQLGADVIRFDQIGGGIDYRRWPITKEGKSLYWHSLNKGKRSIAVDFRKPEGQELLTRLITSPGDNAGLFVTNFPARGWLAEDKLRAQRDDLIYLNLTGDRHGGSALDYTVNSKVGLPFLSGTAEAPMNNPFPAWDVIAGQHIALGLLAAERHRRMTGEGQFIKLSLADVALATMGHLGYLSEVEVNGHSRQPMGNHIFGTFGHDFVCKDKERVMIVGVSPNQWRAIVKVTGTEVQVMELEKKLNLNFKQEGDRFEARESLKQLFEPWFLQHDSKSVHKALEEGGVCWGPYQSVQQLVENDVDCSEDNPLFSKVEQPGIGAYLVPSNPLGFTGLDRLDEKPAPLLGQHTDEILADILGLSSSQIGQLHDQSVIAGADENQAMG